MQKRCQNYLDQYVVDKLTLRVFNCTWAGVEAQNPLLGLRRHELPHILVMSRCTENTSAFFSGYEEITADVCHDAGGGGVRVWRQPGLTMWQGSEVIYGTGFVGDDAPTALTGGESTSSPHHPHSDITLSLGHTRVHDVLHDPKDRYVGVYDGAFLIVVGDGTYYAEHRILTRSSTLTRVFSNRAKSTIVTEKLPTYATKPRSPRGRLFYNLTTSLGRYDSPADMSALLSVKRAIYKSKGKITRARLSCIVDEECAGGLVRRRLIQACDGHYYAMTVRGNYLAYSSQCKTSPSERTQHYNRTPGTPGRVGVGRQTGPRAAGLLLPQFFQTWTMGG